MFCAHVNWLCALVAKRWTVVLIIPHMPIGMLGIYRLLFFCLSAKILITDISGMGWHRAMKFCRMVDLGVHQVISPFVNFGPGVNPTKPKSEKLW